MVLVAQASPAGLRPALCRVLAELGEVQVRLRAPELAALAPGSVALLRVVPEDILWLNYNRPLVSERRLKLVLWAEGEVASAMRAQAPDFFDWISHVLPCPRLTPGFALSGVKALGPGSLLLLDDGKVRLRVEAAGDDFHARLARALNECRASVVLSGYGSDIYDNLFRGWHRLEMKAPPSLGASERTEVLWSNRPLGMPDLFTEMGA